MLEGIIANYRQGQVEQAKSDLKRVITAPGQQATANPLALKVLLKILAEEGDPDIVRYLNDFISGPALAPADTKFLMQVFKLATEKLEPQTAKQLFEVIVGYYPGDDWPFIVYAGVLHAQGWFKMAAEVLQQSPEASAQRIDPKHLVMLIEMHSKARNESRVEHYLKYAEQHYPNQPEVFINLASFHEERGHKEQAKRFLSRALELDPLNPSAMSRLAYFEDNEAELAALGKQIKLSESSKDISDMERESLLYALGFIFEKQSDFKAAFNAYQRANLLAERRLPRYDPDAVAEKLDKVKARATTSIREHHKVDSTDSAHPIPIFILGGFRSGSTLLEQILVSHPEIDGSGELAQLNKFISESIDDIYHVTEEEIEKFRDFYLSTISGLTDKRFHIDKLPTNIWVVDLIFRALPEAKFIQTCRTKTDMAISTFALQLGKDIPYNTSIDNTLHYAGALETLADYWRNMLPASYRVLHYEALVKSTSAEIEAILQWLGLHWSDNCMTFYNNPNVVKTASLWSIRRPISQSQVGRYERFAPYI